MIGIIECGNGNIQSVSNALDFLELKNCKIHTKEDFNKCSHVILPGVGAFAHGMNSLRASDLIIGLEKHVNKGAPLLGICLGMQLLFEESEEHGNHKGLGFIKGSVKSFKSFDQKLQVPHVGWNECLSSKESPFDINFPFYFTHSFYCESSNKEDILATTEHGAQFDSAVMNKNIVGFQFHPEKSQTHGLNLLKEFASLEC